MLDWTGRHVYTPPIIWVSQGKYRMPTTSIKETIQNRADEIARVKDVGVK